MIVICTLPPDAAGGGAGAGGVGAGAGEDGAGDDVVGAVGELSVVVHAAPASVATHAAIGNKNLIRVVGLLSVIVLNLHQAIVTVRNLESAYGWVARDRPAHGWVGMFC